ncbi:MAG: MtrB/PioB family outer membrane beta-barrel protein, partial [Proteobacteria bacterium]|nr:MtrB/PioB family outer membrane beta-barrel protein [Pseudomonadota bacterium]
MKRKTSLLIIYLAASGVMSGLVPGAASAEDIPVEDQPAVDDTAIDKTAIDQPVADKLSEDKPIFEGPSLTEESELIVPVEFISRPVLNEMQLGIGYVSDDAYKFGRYNGMQTKGPFIIGDFKARYFDEDGRFWSVRGTNLGLESRYLLLEGGVQGRHKFFLEYDELPNYKNNTVQTPFTGIGGNNLSLPSGFDINTNLDASLNSFELETKRRRAKVGAMFIPKEHWQFDIDFSHENKQGVDATGSAIANGTNQMIGNTTIALLPEPIDQDTDIVNATLSYAGDGGQVDLKYQMSLFDNNNNSLSWQDPFNPVASGSMSLAPDNEFHQLSLTGGYTLPYKSR